MFSTRTLLVTAFVTLTFCGQLLAQTTIVFQGGEGTAADTWGYVPVVNAGGPLPPGAVATFPNSGSYSLRAAGGNNVGCSGGANCIVGGGATGCPMHGKSIEFNSVYVACLSDVQLSFYHRSHTFCSGNGFDSGERLYFEVSINGGAWTIVGQVGGFGDYVWTYATNPAGNPSSGVPVVPNPFVYNVPAGTATFAFRVRTNTNRADEVFYVDDVKLTTTSTGYNFPGIAGLWNGIVNSDWNNQCNWDSRILPTATTDVLIPSSALNSCEVLPFGTGDCRNLVIDKSRLAAEYFTSTLNVNGDLTIEVNGELDLSLNATEGGTLNLSGDWLNKRDASYFTEDGSTVNLIGGAIQVLSVTNDTKEAFYKLGINKTGGQARLFDDVWIDPSNNGGAVAMLECSNGQLLLNTHEITVFNPAPSAVVRTGGGIISERTDNASRITWHIGSGTGNYLFPFIKTNSVYIPFEMEQVAGSAGVVTVSTYPTPADNLPWPVSPVTVANLISASGLLPDNRDATADRYWHIETTGSAVANLNFTYASTELPAAPYNNPVSMKAQRYEPFSDIWQPYLPGQSAVAYTVTVPSVNAFGTWTLTNEISPLPVTWLDFTAESKNESTWLRWITASEINNDYFTAERSSDGVNFEAFATIKGAGNTLTATAYTTVDAEPYPGINYYRIRQTDYDGTTAFSNVKIVRHDQKSSVEPMLYPNPAQDYFYIQCSSNESLSPLILSDVTGKTIKELNPSICPDNFVLIDISELSSGLYFVRFGSGKATKLVVN